MSPLEFLWVRLNTWAFQVFQAIMGALRPLGRYLKSHPRAERVADRHGLMIPTDLGAGDYRLIAGLVDPVTGRRLAVRDGAGQAVWSVPGGRAMQTDRPS